MICVTTKLSPVSGCTGSRCAIAAVFLNVKKYRRSAAASPDQKTIIEAMQRDVGEIEVHRKL